MTNKEIPTNIDFEIINVHQINDYISDCEIKVFYNGKNRNGSYISKAVGNQIANTLPKSPIVAFYNEQIDDYEDHAQEMVINKNGIKFVSKTVPYGAVSETAPIVWTQIEDLDGVTREYLVCRGFLWTGRYPHLNKILDNPKGQSMEFFPESIVGDWAKFDNEDNEFFIFNEASISALCILGDNIEPCFEGASVGKPEILYSLKKSEFKQEFNEFMLELNEVLTHNLEEGGKIKVNENKIEQEEIVKEFELNEEAIVDEAVVEDFSVMKVEICVETDEDAKEEGDNKDGMPEDVMPENVIINEIFEVEGDLETESEEEEFACGGKKKSKFEDEEEEVENEFVENSEVIKSELEELQDKYNLLVVDFSSLKEEYNLLLDIKQQRDLSQKELMCQKFSILGEEVMSKFETELDKYTVEELEEKLSAIAFKKGINFNLITEEGIFTPVPQNGNHKNTAPVWLQAVEARTNK